MHKLALASFVLMLTPTQPSDDDFTKGQPANQTRVPNLLCLWNVKKTKNAE